MHEVIRPIFYSVENFKLGNFCSVSVSLAKKHLPYVSATQSGIVQIAYNYEKPVVTTDVGGLSEVVIDGLTGYVVPPQNPEALAGAIIKFFEEEKAAGFSRNIHREKEKYSWDRLVEAIEGFVTEERTEKP